MEELYMPSNDGEISFVETDGGSILLEQGSQGFIQPEQGQSNAGTTIYAPQVYIIQDAPVMPRQAETQYLYGDLSSSQIPLSLLQGKSGTAIVQNIQTGHSSNAEYATQHLPVRHILQVVQHQQPTMQISNSQLLQYPVQQHVLQQGHITLAQQPITYTAAMPKGAPDIKGKVHYLRQPLSIANIQGIGQRGGFRFNTPSTIRYAIQQTRAPRQFLQQVQQHPQSSVPVMHRPVLQDSQITASVAQPQAVLRSVQTSCARPEFTTTFQETFEKQQIGRTAISQSRGRGKRSNVTQRHKLSQNLNEQQNSLQVVSKQVPQINYVPKKSNIIATNPQQIGSNIISASQQTGSSVPSLNQSQQKFSKSASPAHPQHKVSNITAPSPLQQKCSNITTVYSQQKCSTVISPSHSHPKCSTTVLSTQSQQNSSNISSLPQSPQKEGNFISPVHPKQKGANIVPTTTTQQGLSHDVNSISAFVRCNSDSSYSLSIPEDNGEPASTTIPITVESIESAQDKNSLATLTKHRKIPAKKILSLEQYKARNPLISPTKFDKNDSAEMRPPASSMVQHKMLFFNASNGKQKIFLPTSRRPTVGGVSQQSTSILKEIRNDDSVCNSQMNEENTTDVVTTLSSADASSLKDIVNSRQKINTSQETLIVCQHCGIENEAQAFCFNCKHILKQDVRLVTANEVTTSMSSTNNLFEEPMVSKQEFYGKNVVTKVIPTEKKLPFNSNSSNKSKGTRGRGRGKQKTYEEPEILTLSSDDDDDGSKSSTVSGPAITDQILGLKQFSLPMSTQISSLEPNMAPDMEDLLDSVTNTCIYSGENEQGGDRIYSPVCIEYRSVRVGSYKYVPELGGEKVEIVKNGFIRFNVTSCFGNGDDNLASAEKVKVTLTIPFVHMARILFHHGNSIPVIFIYLRPTEARNISKLLHMNESSGKLDPTGAECEKRITLLLNKLDEDIKSVLKSYLDIHTINKVTGKTSKLTYEINHEYANEILVKSSQPESIDMLNRAAAASSHQAETKTYLIFPPPPNKGGITITEDDYGCLEEEQFLNDVILDFYLKWLLLNKLASQNRERTHIFSTFFYKRLTSKPRKVKALNSSENNPDLSPAQKRHARVKSWTKSVDIFEKDFILIPINEHSHWFLAVICFPGLSGPVSINDGQPVQNVTDQQKKCKAKIKAKTEVPSIDEGEWSDRDEAEGDGDELEDEEEDEESKEKEQKKISNIVKEEDSDKGEEADSDQVVPAQEEITKTVEATKVESPTYHFKIPDNEAIHHKEKIGKSKTAPGLAMKQPCILIFDSLAGASRHRIVATLRDYLSVEYFEKKKVKKDFSKDIMKGACPKVPQQTNFSDCGIFTLQFAESFFEKPIQNFKLPIKTLRDWFPQELVACKRESIAKLIKSLMDQYKPNHGITLRAIKLNLQMNKMDASEEETMEESSEATTKSSENQKSMERDADNDVHTKRKLETEGPSVHSQILSISSNNGFPSKSRKINVNSNAREIFKVTQPSGSIIIHKATINPKNTEYNLSKGISSPVTNICNSKPVRIAFVPKRTARVEISKQPSSVNANKVELVVHKEVDQTSCNNVTETVDNKSSRRFEIRDEDTSEVLLIFNDPVSSTNEDSGDMNTTSETNDSQIITSSVNDPDSKNSMVSQVQETNQVAISFPFSTVSSASSSPSCLSFSEETNTSFRASSSDIAFDKLLQSSNHSQSLPSSVNANSMIFVSQPKYIQCSSSYITLNSNDPQLIYSRAPVVIQKDNLKQISTCSVPGRSTNTLQSSKIIGSNLVNNPLSTGSTRTYSNNLSADANIKFLTTSSVDSNKSHPRLVDSLNGYPGTHSSKITEISTCQVTAYSNAPTCTSACTMASKTLYKVSTPSSTLAPVASSQGTPSSFGSGTKNVSSHISLTNHPTNAKLLVTSRKENNISSDQNFPSSNIVNVSNSVISTPMTVLSQPKLTTVTRSLLRGPMMSLNTQEKSTKMIVTQQNMPIFTSLQSTTSITNSSSTIGEKCFYVQSPSLQVTTESSNNLFSNSISAASTYSQSQHTDSNLCSGPFSQNCSSSYDQFNSSVSQRLSDSELLLSFASQSSVLSPSINIPTISTISSSGEFCFSPPPISNNSTFTTQHSEMQQQHALVQCAPSTVGLGSPMNNVPSTYHSFTPTCQVDTVTRQSSTVYQSITSPSQSQLVHPSAAASTTLLHNSIQNSTNHAKSSNTIPQFKSLAARVSSSSSSSTKSQRKPRTPGRTTKSPIRHSSKTTSASTYLSTSSVSSPNKTIIGLAKLDNVSGHQTTSANLISSQPLNSGMNHAITMFSPNSKMKISPSFEALSKPKTSTPVSQSFLPDKSSHVPTLKSSQTSSSNFQTPLNSPLRPSSLSLEELSNDSQSSKSLNVSPMLSGMLTPSKSSEQLPSRLTNCNVSMGQSSISTSTVCLATTPTSYAQFIPSNKVMQIPAPSKAASSMIETSHSADCTTPPIKADNLFAPLEPSIKSINPNQSPNSFSSRSPPHSVDSGTSASTTSSLKSSGPLNTGGSAPLKSKIPVSPPHPYNAGIAGSPSQAPVKSMPSTSSLDSNLLKLQESIPKSTILNKNYVEELTPHSTLCATLNQAYSSPSPSPPPFHMPATRTSSGRNVSIPKRFLDSEQEQFFVNKKREKVSSPRGGIKSAKKAKKNSPLGII